MTDPVCAVPTLTLTCNVIDPITREPYSRDPRYIGQKAEAYLKQTGIADVSYWGPEAEFFVFDSVRFEQQQNFGYYFIDSDEGIWNSGKDGGTPNLAHRAALEGRLLPGRARRSTAGFPIGSDSKVGGSGCARRGASPRSGDCRSMRDRYALHQPRRYGRSSADVQVCDQEHREGAGQDRDLHAEAIVG